MELNERIEDLTARILCCEILVTILSGQPLAWTQAILPVVRAMLQQKLDERALTDQGGDLHIDPIISHLNAQILEYSKMVYCLQAIITLFSTVHPSMINWIKTFLDPMLNTLSEFKRKREQFINVNNRIYWLPGDRINPPTLFFEQYRYLPKPNSKPDLDLALSAIETDCIGDIHEVIKRIKCSLKIWVTIQVRYESADPDANPHKEFTPF
jgi:hypothetical protein